jgi:hypothetical protein
MSNEYCNLSLVFSNNCTATSVARFDTSFSPNSHLDSKSWIEIYHCYGNRFVRSDRFIGVMYNMYTKRVEVSKALGKQAYLVMECGNREYTSDIMYDTRLQPWEHLDPTSWIPTCSGIDTIMLRTKDIVSVRYSE